MIILMGTVMQGSSFTGVAFFFVNTNLLAHESVQR